MQQTRLESLIESLMNIAIGYSVALLSQIVIFPLFGINVPLSTNLLIGTWFTVISLVRSYIVRRWFNARLHSAAQAMARGRLQKSASGGMVMPRDAQFQACIGCQQALQQIELGATAATCGVCRAGWLRSSP